MSENTAEASKHAEGKDELNLAEFPLSAISDRFDPQQKTMIFEDRVWDKSRGETITRQLLITAADEYGLPTALDDEVILGLVQLSRLQGFADRRVTFTRYQLIQLLGWRDESKSYDRIEKSLNRWIGVTLYYQNAWRDRELACWVDEKFHLLDNVTLYDREKVSRARTTQTMLPISSFTWNEKVFRSFRAGNLKSLDFEFYKRLESAVSKRLYRFLDKRFFHRTRCEFNLKELCWEHVGLARTYDTANLKRKLRGAVAELERNGFIRECPDYERFRRLSSGEWKVFFEKAGKGGEKKVLEKAPDDGLFSALTERGIARSVASDLVESFPRDRIEHQIEVFDWMVDQKDTRLQRNPPGYLVSAIRGEYLAPKEFQDRKTQAELEARAESARLKREAKAERQRLEAERRTEAEAGAIRNFWNSLSEVERQRLEAEAMESAVSACVKTG